MDAIVAHVNADFDTLASMVAAEKLYPGAELIFPGSLEKGLEEAIAKLNLPHRFKRPKDVDLSAIRRLILVDVKNASRIGALSQLVGAPGMTIHIYDHHPAAPGDIAADLMVSKPYGSTTTVLAHILKERGIVPSPDEATLLMAGIYEDTGSLTYPSTTSKDLEAGAFLLECGADLGVVAGFIRHEMTPEEVELLNELIRSETTYSIGGVEVVIAEGYVDKYPGDMAPLAHRLRDIGNLQCLFLLIDAEDRVNVIARSSCRAIDAGEVARALGGGGHSTAASATIKGVTLIQAKELLLSAAKKTLVPDKTAREIMSRPAIVVPETLPISEALDLMRRYNVNATPALRSDNSVSGVITRQVADKAVFHGLAKAPVLEFMSTDFESLRPDAPVEEIREAVFAHGQRLIPIIEGRAVVGVVTRTDLVKLLQEELRERPSEQRKGKTVSRLLKERLPEWAFDLLKKAGEVAKSSGCEAYAVGGFARDLVMRRENLDIDIVVEGDGIEFAKTLALAVGARVRAHQRFKTAVLIFPDDFKLDVATARLEYYERPGALPTVERSSLKLDLYRRDFIINTLAISLNPGSFGALIDFFGAQKDIKDKTIRVLHNLSFIEDPTRALRAARFSVKFGFKIARHTQNLIKNALRRGAISSVSGPRLLDELKHILMEDSAIRIVERLDEMGLLAAIDPAITWGPERQRFMESVRDALVWHRRLYSKEEAEGWVVLLLGLTDSLDGETYDALIKRLMVAGKKTLWALGSRQEALEVLRVLGGRKPLKMSAVCVALNPLPIETILYMSAKAKDDHARKLLYKYISEFRFMETHLKGADLLRMGVPPGPAMGDLLDTLLVKRIDGEITTREEEAAFVGARLREARNKAAHLTRKSSGKIIKK